MREILDITQDMARDLIKAEAMDEISMGKINALCLPPKFRLVDIRRIRMAPHPSLK